MIYLRSTLQKFSWSCPFLRSHYPWERRNRGTDISSKHIYGWTRTNVCPHAGVLYHPHYHPHQRTLTVGYGSKRRICTENRPPAEVYGAYTLDLKTGVGQLTVDSESHSLRHSQFVARKKITSSVWRYLKNSLDFAKSCSACSEFPSDSYAVPLLW